jgi:hypothetical protein
MIRSLAKVAAPIALAAGSLALVLGATPSGAATAPRAVVAHSSVTWPGVVDSVALGKHRFVYTWDSYRYTVTYTSKTKWTKGSPRSLKKGLHVTVTGNLNGMRIAATKIVA